MRTRWRLVSDLSLCVKSAQSCEHRVCTQVCFCDFPTLMTGDIRVVTAVDHPRLRHLKNVIVFSVCGWPVPPM